VEKILLIHNPPRVYYHYYPFFLSKLTKEGKLSRRRQRCSHPTAHGQAGMTHTPFCLQKKNRAGHRGHNDVDDDASF
jgi:hypothetical protein